MVKYNRIFRTLALALVLSLLVMAIPATPAFAASVDVSPSKRAIGEYIDVDGSGFPASNLTTPPYHYSEVDIYLSSQEADTGDEIDDEVTIYELVKSGVLVGEDGRFSTRFKVPSGLTDGDEDEDVHGGTYYVYVTYAGYDRIRADDHFTVIGIEQIDPNEGPVGTEVEIVGVGFDGNKTIKLFYDAAEIDIASGDEKTESDGEFTSTIIIPESTAGVHTITAEFGGEKGEAKFTVEPAITISLTSGAVGDEVTVSGTGFAKSKDITITFDGDDEVATDETNTKGSFTVSFNVPSVAPATYDVEAEDEDDNTAKAEFTLAAAATLSPTTGNIGTPLTISGTGFTVGGAVIITYDGVQVVTATVDSNGAFTATFEAPASIGGEHTITATDGTSITTSTFTMESTAPPIPPPLLPLMGDKAESMAYFDWEDVDDPSKPVTYTLQIASDADFTTIVLEKEGLTVSEYALTEEEKLESTSKEAPYYWRIRAIDGASNASDWTAPGSFYIGFVFELKGWILYTLMGVGGLLLFFLGLWIGRRTAFY